MEKSNKSHFSYVWGYETVDNNVLKQPSVLFVEICAVFQFHQIYVSFGADSDLTRDFTQ